jgi:hypothetical protein
MLAPPTVPEVPVTLALRVLSFVGAAWSGPRIGAGDGEGVSSIDSDMCTSMKDMAGFWDPAPCWSFEDGTLRLNVGFLADCIAAS